MEEGLLLAGNIDDEEAFGGMAADDPEGGLTIAGLEEVRLLLGICFFGRVTGNGWRAD